MDLSFKKNFIIEEEHDKIAVCGNLKCDCGCDEFKIFHTGKQTKGIFSSHLKKEEKQILIEAKCAKCGKNIKLYDTSIDGEKPTTISHFDEKQFIYKNNEEFKVKIFLNYYEENYMTNKFVSIYIHLVDDKGKTIVLFEE